MIDENKDTIHENFPIRIFSLLNKDPDERKPVEFLLVTPQASNQEAALWRTAASPSGVV